MKKLILLFALILNSLCFGVANISVTATGNTITINDGANIYCPTKSLVAVIADVGANTVTIQWDSNNRLTFAYTMFSTPSGTSAADVASQIQRLLR